ncbi:MAG: DNA-binding protein [Saprospiraceae bacterium]|nr:DNA-binding protein [Saprospiraceae bacterium]
MNLTLDELRQIKHSLPTGSIKRIADELNVDEQTVRNYFGAHHLENTGNHIQPGPNGGIVHIEDETILNLAKKIISESSGAN